MKKQYEDPLVKALEALPDDCPWKKHGIAIATYQCRSRTDNISAAHLSAVDAVQHACTNNINSALASISISIGRVLKGDVPYQLKSSINAFYYCLTEAENAKGGKEEVFEHNFMPKKRDDDDGGSGVLSPSPSPNTPSPLSRKSDPAEYLAA